MWFSPITYYRITYTWHILSSCLTSYTKLFLHLSHDFWLALMVIVEVFDVSHILGPRVVKTFAHDSGSILTKLVIHLRGDHWFTLSKLVVDTSPVFTRIGNILIGWLSILNNLLCLNCISISSYNLFFNICRNNFIPLKLVKKLKLIVIWYLSSIFNVWAHISLLERQITLCWFLVFNVYSYSLYFKVEKQRN